MLLRSASKSLPVDAASHSGTLETIFMDFMLFNRGPASVVLTATGYGLDGTGIDSRWGAKFSSPVHNGPGAHPASSTMGTGSFPEVKSGRDVTLTPHPLLVPLSRKTRAIPLLPLWAVQRARSLSASTEVHINFALYYSFRALTMANL